MTKARSLSRLFSVSRFSGENYTAYRHFKKVPSSVGKKLLSVFDRRSVVVVPTKKPFTIDYSLSTEKATVSYFVQRYSHDNLPIDVSLQTLINTDT